MGSGAQHSHKLITHSKVRKSKAPSKAGMAGHQARRPNAIPANPQPLGSYVPFG